MKSIRIGDVMLPLREYATVSQEATLYDAVRALEAAQENFDVSRDRHRAILAYDENRRIVGKLSQLDVLRALEPKYQKLGDLKTAQRFGFSRNFMSSMLSYYGLWQTPLEDICRKAAELRVKDIMYTPSEGEFVEADATLDLAIHQLVMGHHQSLLVTRDNEIVGILRLTDVFQRICSLIKVCKL
ncbi:MAG: CBS domain-containing protein [Desulfobacterales bacterium]|nr:MAG: CBS domain-containing protein [Desulfobacterales bacterium]